MDPFGKRPISYGGDTAYPGFTGTVHDFIGRLRRQLPRSWFQGPTPVLDALLRGPAWALAISYALYVYAKQQTRISTATGGWLDLIAFDFFNTRLRRRLNQTDDSFRLLILTSLLRERDTKPAIIKVLEDFTGFTPIVREPWRAADNNTYSGRGGYSVGRYYGSVQCPAQTFVDAYRPAPGTPQFGIGDADIYAAVESVRAAGTTIWMRLHDAPTEAGALQFDQSANSGWLGAI